MKTKINIFLEMINILIESNLAKLRMIYSWVARPSSRIWIKGPSPRIWIRGPSSRVWIRGPFTRDRDPTGVSSLGDFDVKTSATSVTIAEEVESEDVTSGWEFQ